MTGQANLQGRGHATDRAAQERAITGILLLEFAPVAVTRLVSAEEFASFDAARPVRALHYCAAVRRAAAGEALKLEARDMACDTSPRFLGFEGGHDDVAFVESYAQGGLYRDHDVTKHVLEDAAVLPPLVGLGVVPLGLQPEGIDPDVLVVMTDPHGAMRLAQAAGYLGHKMAQQTIGMHGMCVETTAAPIVRGEMNVSLLCSGARHTGEWPDSVLSVGIPGHMIDDVVTGLCLTADRFEPDRRKSRIMASQLGDETPQLVPGNAYFLS